MGLIIKDAVTVLSRGLLLCSLWMGYALAEEPAAQVSIEELADTYEFLSPAEIKAGRDALARLNSTPRYIVHADEREQWETDVQMQCEGMPPTDCFRFLRSQPATVLRGVPDSPIYWQRYWEVIDATPIGFEADVEPDGPRYDYREMLSSGNNWYLRDLAREGHIDPDKVHRYLTGVRRVYGRMESLLHQIYYLAFIGQGMLPWSYAMAEASARSDSSEMRRLMTLVRPMDEAEADFLRVVVGESWLMMQNLPDGGDWDTEHFLRSYLLSADELSDLGSAGSKYLEQYAETLLSAAVETQAKGWSQFWREGSVNVDARLEDNPLIDTGWGDAYGYYEVSHRLQENLFTVARAVGEMYQGIVSPGLPGRPAPDHFRWEWMEDSVLCLEPTSTIHPSLSAHAMCVPYLDPSEI